MLPSVVKATFFPESVPIDVERISMAGWRGAVERWLQLKLLSSRLQLSRI
jgi:hypothetical protein